MNQNKELFNLIKNKIFKNKTKPDSVIKMKNCYGTKLEIRKKASKFLKLGEILAILETISESRELYKSINENSCKLNNNGLNCFKDETLELGYGECTSVEVCKKLLDILCYKDKELFMEKKKNEVIEFLANCWENYNHIFKYGFKTVYNYINENRNDIIFTIQEQALNEQKKNLVISNIYNFNEYDLKRKFNIMEMQFNMDKTKNITEKIINFSYKSKNEILSLVENIADFITTKSIIGKDKEGLNRSWIGFKYNENNELEYECLELDFKQGVIGIAYFYIEIFKITNNTYYLNLAKEAVAFNNIESINSIYNYIEEIVTLYRMLYEITKEDRYIYKFENARLNKYYYGKKKEMFRKVISDSSPRKLKKFNGEYFLGIENGLAGLGLDLIELYRKYE